MARREYPGRRAHDARTGSRGNGPLEQWPRESRTPGRFAPGRPTYVAQPVFSATSPACTGPGILTPSHGPKCSTPTTRTSGVIARASSVTRGCQERRFSCPSSTPSRARCHRYRHAATRRPLGPLGRTPAGCRGGHVVAAARRCARKRAEGLRCRRSSGSSWRSGSRRRVQPTRVTHRLRGPTVLSVTRWSASSSRSRTRGHSSGPSGTLTGSVDESARSSSIPSCCQDPRCRGPSSRTASSVPAAAGDVAEVAAAGEREHRARQRRSPGGANHERVPTAVVQREHVGLQ